MKVALGAGEGLGELGVGKLRLGGGGTQQGGGISQLQPVRVGNLIDSSNPRPSLAPGAMASPIAFSASASVAEPSFELISPPSPFVSVSSPAS